MVTVDLDDISLGKYCPSWRERGIGSMLGGSRWKIIQLVDWAVGPIVKRNTSETADYIFRVLLKIWNFEGSLVLYSARKEINMI